MDQKALFQPLLDRESRSQEQIFFVAECCRLRSELKVKTLGKLHMNELYLMYVVSWAIDLQKRLP